MRPRPTKPRRHSRDSADSMQRLRAATAEVHAATERLQLMRALLSEAPTLADYASYIGALAAVYSRIEPAIERAVPATIRSHLGVLPKVPALARDLEALERDGVAAGLARRVAATSARAPTLRNLSQGLGGLYVLEGATLGGRIIAAHLSRRMRLPSGDLPLEFLSFHGPHEGGHWKCFSAAMSRLSSPAPSLQSDADVDLALARKIDVEQMIIGALDTFAAVQDSLARVPVTGAA